MIAKISIGGGFRGALDYLMKQKPEKEEREHQRDQERQKQEAERTPQKDAGTGAGGGSRVDQDRANPGSAEGQERQARQENEKRGPHPPQERDLAEAYEKGQRHRIIGGNLTGQTPRELAREFGAIRQQRPDIKNPVHHASISAGENDRLTVQQWQEIAEKYVERMGFKDSPYVVIQHRDTGRDHIHIVASRVDAHGHVVNEWQNKPRSEELMRELERDYGLEKVRASKEVVRPAPTRAEQEMFERSGRLSVKMRFQGHIERALKSQPTATQFIEEMQRVGIDVIPNVQSTGRVSGITFRQGEEVMKGSDVGRGYSWGALQKRGLSYDQERDRPAIEAARERADAGRDPERTITAAPARSFGDTVAELGQSLGRSAGQYLLDQVNPVRQLENLNPLKQIENQLLTVQTIGRGLAEGYNMARDLLSKQQDPVEQLHQAAGLEPADKDALEKLHQAAGLEPPRDTTDALQRLNQAAGLEHDPSTVTAQDLDKTLGPSPGVTPALEHVAEQEVTEHVVEQTIDLLIL